MSIFLIFGWLLLIVGLSCWANVFYSLYLLFRTRLLVALPLNEKFKNFTVTKQGGYAIWHEGPIFKQAAVSFSRPQIIKLDNQQIVPLSSSLGRMTKNGWTRASALAFYCELDEGDYCIEAFAGSSLSPIEDKVSQTIINHLPINKAPESQYRFLVQESITTKRRVIMFICIFAGLFCFNIGLFTILEINLGVKMEVTLMSILGVE